MKWIRPLGVPIKDLWATDQERWSPLVGSSLLSNVIEVGKFRDGNEVTEPEAQTIGARAA